MSWRSDDIFAHCMYSRNHCFVIMPKSAEDKLRTRLRNQRELIQTIDSAARKGGAGDAGGRALFAICAEIWKRRSVVVCVLSGERPWYDSITNAVRTAEKRPACQHGTVSQYRRTSSDGWTKTRTKVRSVLMSSLKSSIMLLSKPRK